MQDSGVNDGVSFGPFSGAPQGMTVRGCQGRQLPVRHTRSKHFNNVDLRAFGEDVPVYEQIARYEQYLSKHSRVIEESYTQVVKNLVAIEKMRREPRRLPPQVTDVAEGRRKLMLSAQPKVGLVIFGFDKAQRDDPNWKHHLGRLKDKVAPVIAVGDPKGVRLKL